jgi:2-polyprenyl-3-methyl-5-hydroxy-6-metoxy-1,4-benzoquinol methylase
MGWWDWSDFDAASFYDESYFQSAAAQRGYDDYDSLEPGLRRTARTRLRALRRAAADSGASRKTTGPGALDRSRLFDVGCGTGVFLDEARRGGFETAGLEVSAYAAERARARGLNVQCGAVDDFAPAPGSFDAITMWDVIEHLKHPAATVDRLARALRPGGVLALSTGDLGSLCARISGRRWHLFNLPEHLYFFTPRSLRSLLRRAGLAVSFVRRELTWFPASYLVERLCKFGLAPRVRSEPGPLRRLTLPATLLDIVSVYAAKPMAGGNGVTR